MSERSWSIRVEPTKHDPHPLKRWRSTLLEDGETFTFDYYTGFDELKTKNAVFSHVTRRGAIRMARRMKRRAEKGWRRTERQEEEKQRRRRQAEEDRSREQIIDLPE